MDPMQLLRQAGILVAMAASVALGVYVVLWSRTPEYAVLYNDLSERDASAILDALQAAEIPYRINHDAGTVMVPAGRAAEARMDLAAAGLPRSLGQGFELLDQEQSFGASQFIEQARYQRAIEGELSRSITHVQNVRNARVHLAIPRQSVFTRDREAPSASVLVELFPGRRLEPAQVEAIVRLVAASVPNLSAEKVTVVDQRGTLLSEDTGGGELALTARQFEYVRKVEDAYVDRVRAILMPIVGHDGVQAQVTAAFDFTQTEEFNDRWNPEQSAVRSEQTLEEERLGQGGAGGVPGALSNEPPGEATAPETSVAEAAEAEGQVFNDPTLAQPRNRRSETVRNYEVDRTVSHSKPTVGTIKRLSVAVVVRNPAPDEDAEEGESAAFPQETLDRMTQLVKEAIGFDETRGDTVSVLNADFFAPEEEEPLPEPAIWEQPWVWAVGKQVLGGVFVLFLVLGVLRPVFKTLMARPPAAPAMLAAPQGQALLADGGALAARPAGMQPGAPLALAGPGGIDTDLERVKSYVAQDPKVAAQVVKTWVGDQS